MIREAHRSRDRGAHALKGKSALTQIYGLVAAPNSDVDPRTT